MNNEQNIAFMNDSRRVEAQNRLNKAVSSIQASLKFNGNAMYYLTVLPQKLKELSEAYENLSIVEASVESEITGHVGFHRYTAP